MIDLGQVLSRGLQVERAGIDESGRFTEIEDKLRYLKQRRSDVVFIQENLIAGLSV